MSPYINGLFLGNLYPNETVGGAIDIFKDVWPGTQETIDAIENECNTSGSGVNWSRATTIGQGTNQSKRTNYHMGLTEIATTTDNLLVQNIHNQFYTLLTSALGPYVKKQGIDEFLYHEGYNMLKYSGGQEYKAHYDGGSSTGRCVSAILYLNSDFEGGEVEFTNFGIKIKPEPGMLLIFPSNYAYTHIAHPVTSGTKYAIVTWIKDINN
jgi:predicted 2-oxoglutarate/Fe(II)-dependent dioxygenase YbiX